MFTVFMTSVSGTVLCIWIAFLIRDLNNNDKSGMLSSMLGIFVAMLGFVLWGGALINDIVANSQLT